MLDFLRFARDLATDVFRSHLKLVDENALLRQQWIVAERKIRAVPVLGGLHHDYRRAA